MYLEMIGPTLVRQLKCLFPHNIMCDVNITYGNVQVHLQLRTSLTFLYCVGVVSGGCIIEN